jgi:hypothetical protein
MLHVCGYLQKVDRVIHVKAEVIKPLPVEKLVNSLEKKTNLASRLSTEATTTRSAANDSIALLAKCFDDHSVS